MSSEQREEKLKRFESWFLGNGGAIHRHASLVSDGENTCFRAREDIHAQENIVSCPFSLAITSDTADRALTSLCDLRDAAQYSARQRICSYICLHWIIPEEQDKKQVLRHRPYLDILPISDMILTPLYFSDDELELFRGTNIYQATINQKINLEKQYNEICAAIGGQAEVIARKMTLDMYTLAAVYLDSRAFPSTVLSPTPSLLETPSSYAILIPGVDSLNHKRAHPITWSVCKVASHRGSSDGGSSSELSLSLIAETKTSAGEEVLNNYGAKPNSSLILGYGFALPNNPDDTISLKLALRDASEGLSSQSAVQVGRSARGAEELWECARAHFWAQAAKDDDEEPQPQDKSIAELEVDLDVLDVLQDLVGELCRRFNTLLERSGAGSKSLRGMKIREMQKWFVQGQYDITSDLEAWLQTRRQDLLRRQEELGVIFDEGGLLEE